MAEENEATPSPSADAERSAESNNENDPEAIIRDEEVNGTSQESGGRITTANSNARTKLNSSGYQKYFEEVDCKNGKLVVKCIVCVGPDKNCDKTITVQLKSYSNLSRHLKVSF